MNPLIQLKQTTSVFLIAFELAWFGLSPAVQAVSPAPDGGYPNFTTAEGDKALFSLTTGAGNTAVGWRSLFLDTTGSFNTGVGAGALVLNTADSNTAVGTAALLLNTSGTENTAVGTAALVNNATGSFNNAVGAFALNDNTTGLENTAVGRNALFHNQTGENNTAIGVDALENNVGSSDNVALGAFAADFVTGERNTAVGAFAGANSTGITSGIGNTVVGFGAGGHIGAGGVNIYIGDMVDPGISESSTIRIGDSSLPVLGTTSTCFIAGISGQSVGPISAPVVINAGGQLGTIASSARFKKDIATMEKASEAILSLRPVTFHYKTDTQGVPQFGLIAEEVAKVNPALVLPDKEGKPYSVRYDQVNAMLLNEFLKEHSKVEQMQKQIEALTAGLQKVSAQLEMSKPASQTVLNSQ